MHEKSESDQHVSHDVLWVGLNGKHFAEKVVCVQRAGKGLRIGVLEAKQRDGAGRG